MRFNRSLTPHTKVDLIPMIDIVFQLVVFFMVATTMNTTPAVQIDFPTSTSAENVPVTKLTITLKNDYEVFLGEEPFTLEALEARLGGISESERQGIQSILLQGDRSVSYETMIQVLDILRNTGFRGVSLKTLVGDS